MENIKHSDKEALSMDKLRSYMDPLASQLLALSKYPPHLSALSLPPVSLPYPFTLHPDIFFTAFSREHSIRLDNAGVLKSLFQNRLISDKVIEK